MRDFLVRYIPDPGAVIFVVLGLVAFVILFRMLKAARVDGLMDDPVERDSTPPARVTPEDDLRTRGF